MTKEAKISLLVSLSAITVIGVFAFRKPISRALFGATLFNLKTTNKAKKEWKKWQKGQAKEDDADMYKRLEKYWQSVGWDSDRWTPTGVAWSGAFISSVMKSSGAKDDFKYSSSHSTYIRDSISNKKNNTNKRFKGYKPSEINLKKGDLVCYARESGVDYNTTNSYKSHCDIVVKLKKESAEIIGGNVSNSVTKKEVSVKNGKLNDSKFFVVIRNDK